MGLVLRTSIGEGRKESRLTGRERLLLNSLSAYSKHQRRPMKAITTSNRRPQCRALCALLLGIAALWAPPSVARAQLFVSQSNAGSVGEYDATTGAAINASFITGLNQPLFGIAVSGKHFFVVNNDTTVGEYDAGTGEAINVSFITGLNGPLGLAISGNSLFVTNNGDGTVGEYNATTGAAMNPRLITLSGPADLAVSDNHLFVVYNSTTVGEYDATTGAAINANLITGLLTSFGLAVSGNHLFVTNFFESTVREYNATTGAAINPRFITGLDEPDGLAVSGNTLFVSSGGSGLAQPSGNVGEYDASTGTAVNASLITGLNGPTGLAVGAVPEPSPWSTMACGGVVLLGIMLRNKHRIPSGQRYRVWRFARLRSPGRTSALRKLQGHANLNTVQADRKTNRAGEDLNRSVGLADRGRPRES